MAYFFFSDPTPASAAVTDDYRSVASGNWNSTATWLRYNGSAWVAATTTPTSANKTITIEANHTVAVTANVTIDQVVIASGGTIDLKSGVTLTIANGAGVDLSVSGILRNAGTVSMNGGASANYLSGGKYQHNFTTTAGTIPAASWSAGSTCEIIGYTTNTTLPSGIQSFHHFAWNCPNQSVDFNLNGNITSLAGDWSVDNTGTARLFASTNAITLNVGGNLNISGGVFSISSANTQTSNLNISGNYNQTGGTFSVMTGNGSTGYVNMNGDWTHTGGVLTVGGDVSTNAQVVYKKAGVQTFSAGGNSVSGNVDFTVNGGSTLELGQSVMLGRNFNLLSNGAIQIGSPNGIAASSASGNIQVSGARSFHANADYTYNGLVDQISGNGLPSTHRKLTLSSGKKLTLSQSVAVSNSLVLTNGLLITGNNELHVSSNAVGAITGHSVSSYVVGNLRRTVAANGKYDFPMGSLTNYEYMGVTLSACSGFSSLLGNFINAHPLDPNYPLNGCEVNDIEMNELLDHGYWTLTPNSALTGGTYTVQLKEMGYTNTLPIAGIFAVLARNNPTSSWNSVGAHDDAKQGVAAGVVTAERSALNTFNQYALAFGQYLAFSSPSLISGVDGQIDAIYKFPNVMLGIDAWVKITGISGGASLNDIDNSTTGYSEAFQPFINYPPNSTAYMEWLIMFKKAGTSTDTTIRKMTATGVDVDGSSSNGQTIREFVEATMPTSYAVESGTTLTISNNNGNYRALGSTATVADIDTAARQAMYQMNYNNVSSIMYRTGSISTYTSTQVRQTSLYFRSFNLNQRNIALPVTLLYFNAKLKDKQVNLDWATASEINNDYFTVERSINGEKFSPLVKLRGAGNSTTQKLYFAVDENPLNGYAYYRLKQTDFDGQYTYSPIRTVRNGEGDLAFEIKAIYPNPFSDRIQAGFILGENGSVDITLLSAGTRVVRSLKMPVSNGYNSIELEKLNDLPEGIYYLTIKFGEQMLSRKIVKH